MTLSEWIANGEVGTSSKTMWCALQGIPFDRADVPHDPDDFSRCYQLYILVPEFRSADAFDRIAAMYPWWKPYLDQWRKLERMYCAATSKGESTMPDLYAFMQELYAKSCEIRYPDAEISKRVDGTIRSIYSPGGFSSVSITAEDVKGWQKPKDGKMGKGRNR